MTRRKTLPPLAVEVISISPSSQESNVSNLSFNSGFSIDDSSQQSIPSTQTSIHHSQTPPEHLHSELKSDELEGVVVGAESCIGSDKLGLDHAATTVGVNEISQPATCERPESGLVSCGLNRTTGSTKSVDTPLSTVHATHGPRFATDQLTGIPAVTQDHAEVHSVNDEDQGHCVVSIGHPSLPRRTSSSIRLSTSVDGKAEVVTVTDKEPASLLTDLNLKPRLRGSLQRSQSAVEPNDLFLGSRRASITGRSRDARTWEFYCDSDARNALTEHAARERSGSAVGPIGLIRSRNNKAIGSKRNANPSQREPTKRQKPQDLLAEKPKLARTTSSVARLQSVKNIQKQDMKGKDKYPAALYEDGSDSDKENWEPGTQTSRERRPRRLVNPQMRRRLLEESRNHPSLSCSLGTLMNRDNVSPRHSRPNTSSSHEAIIPKTDAKVAEFMCAKPTEMPEDLDCVQNLLSLSQAAWSRAASE